MTLVIRDVVAADEHAWRQLWSAYAEFYETTMPDVVTYATWSRIIDPEQERFGGIVADLDGTIVGIANYVLHDHTWEIEPRCYLNDLFVSPDARSAGVGRTLIQELLNRAPTHHWSAVYWLTSDANVRARRLYDQFTPTSGFVQYIVKTEPIHA